MIYIVDVAKLRVGSDKTFVKGDRINLTNDMAAKLIRKAYVKFDAESSKNVIVESDSNESNVSIHTTNESNSTKEEQENNNEQEYKDEQENITDEEVETVNADSFALKPDEYVKASSEKNKKEKVV